MKGVLTEQIITLAMTDIAPFDTWFVDLMLRLNVKETQVRSSGSTEFVMINAINIPYSHAPCSDRKRSSPPNDPFMSLTVY